MEGHRRGRRRDAVDAPDEVLYATPASYSGIAATPGPRPGSSARRRRGHEIVAAGPDVRKHGGFDMDRVAEADACAAPPPESDSPIRGSGNLRLEPNSAYDHPAPEIDVGYFSSPAIADWDRDGDGDLVVGNAAGGVRVYENIGTSVRANFVERARFQGAPASAWAVTKCRGAFKVQWSGRVPEPVGVSAAKFDVDSTEGSSPHRRSRPQRSATRTETASGK